MGTPATSKQRVTTSPAKPVTTSPAKPVTNDNSSISKSGSSQVKIAQHSRLIGTHKKPVGIADDPDSMPLVGNIRMRSKNVVMPKSTEKVSKAVHSISSDNVSLSEKAAPVSYVGEVFEQGWTLSKYMTENKSNKQALKMDIVSKHFPMRVINAAIAGGYVYESKGYLKK